MSLPVQLINASEINSCSYPNQYVGCLVLTKDSRLVLQKRGEDWMNYPDYLCEFGGRIEKEEQPVQAIIRELKEELGAEVHPSELISIGIITETMPNHTDLIHTFFWQDTNGTITGCYEGEIRFFNDSTDIIKEAKITDGLRWLVAECQKRRLIS